MEKILKKHLVQKAKVAPTVNWRLTGEFKQMDEEIYANLKKTKWAEKETKRLREELEMMFRVEKVRVREEQILEEKEKLEAVTVERGELEAWFKRTDKELVEFNRDGKYEDHLSEVVNERRQIKHDLRELYYKNIEGNKSLVDEHEKMRIHFAKVRHMQEMVNNRVEISQSEKRVSNVLAKINQGKIDSLKIEAEKAKKKIKKDEVDFGQELIRQEEELETSIYRNKMLRLKMREKTQENNLANLRIKEINRSIRFKSLKPIGFYNSLMSKDSFDLLTIGNVNKHNEVMGPPQLYRIEADVDSKPLDTPTKDLQ